MRGRGWNSYKTTPTMRVSHSSTNKSPPNITKMNCFKIFLFIFAVALIGVVVGQEEDHHEHEHHEQEHHDHGNSHVHLSQKHKHGEHKFKYDIKHGKHSHIWHGSAYPHGYGGFGI